MNFRLEKVVQLSGREASAYAVFLEGETDSVFAQFVADWRVDYEAEVLELLQRLKAMGQRTGARRNFFKEYEGKRGDLVSALYDIPGRKLRLYCMRFGTDFLILGGGGPKTTRTWQEDENLSYHAELMIGVAARVQQRLDEGGLDWVNDYKDLEGELEFKEEENE